MKRIFRVAIIVIPVAVLLVGIGLWRHHYLTIMNAEPEKLYNTLGKTSNLNTNANVPQITSKKSEDQTNAMAARNDNRITPAEMDNKGNLPVDTTFGDIIVENLPPEALAALRRYEEIQSTSRRIRREELLPLVKESSKDEAAFKAIYDRLKSLKQQRKECLEILAKYSDEAFNELQATIERENNLKRELADLERESKERDAVNKEKDAAFEARYAANREQRAAAQKQMAKSSKLSDKLVEISKALPKMSPGSKEQKQAIEEMRQIREELTELNETF